MTLFVIELYLFQLSADRCAGLCEYHRGGYCVIKLSEKLLKFRTRREMIETLIHEMIHAYLFVTRNNIDRDGHGPNFQKHMRRINVLGGYAISIYHTFLDEVEHYRVHWWQCQGKCRRIIKRASNRKPASHDSWWASHARMCGGEFKKIKEPPQREQKSKPSKKRKREETRRLADRSHRDIADYFSKKRKITSSQSPSPLTSPSPPLLEPSASVLSSPPLLSVAMDNVSSERMRETLLAATERRLHQRTPSFATIEPIRSSDSSSSGLAHVTSDQEFENKSSAFSPVMFIDLT